MKKKVLALLLTFLMMFGMLPATTFANEDGQAYDFADMPNNWSTAALKRAVDNGLLKGFVIEGKTLINADAPLKRAEMAAVVNRAFGAAKIADLKGVTDVPSTAWYASDMAKAVMMGTFVKDAKMRPESNITRQEAFVVLARAFKTISADTDLKLLDNFTDKADISTWAQEDLNAMAAAGYINGSPDGKLNPKANITRAEFAAVMDNLVKQYIDKPREVTDVVASGNVLVRISGVALKNVTVKGDLIIADGVGDGDVTLDNVNVEGRTVVRGGGENSIIIKGNSDLGKVVVCKVDGKVRIAVEGAAGVEVIYVDDGSDDVLVEGIIGTLEVAGDNITAIATKAFFTNAIVSGDNSKIVLRTGSTLKDGTISGSLSGIIVDKGANAEKIIVSGSDAKVEGSGTVKNVEVKADGDNASITTPNTKIETAEGAEGVIAAGGAPIESGTSATNNNAGTWIVTPPASGGGRGSSSAKISAINIATDIDVTSGVDNDAVVEVTLTTATTGADIYYTTDGSTPTTSSTKYTMPFNLEANDTGGKTITVKAIGIKSGYTNSAVAEKEIVFKPTDAEFAGGDGTEANPYQVATAEQLNNVRNHLDKYFIQIADIDLGVAPWNQDEGWEPIGTDELPFTGNYDGNNKTISNLKIERPEQNYVGLFGKNEGSISSVSLLDINVSGYGYVGGLIGENFSGIVVGNNVSGTVIGGVSGIGGLIGFSVDASQVTGCYSAGSVSAPDGHYVGGLMGASYDSAVSESYSTSTVVGGEYYIAGLVGSNYNSTIARCFATGDVTGSNAVGGLVGDSLYGGKIIDSYATGSVTGSADKVGGLVGDNYGAGAQIFNSYATGQVTGGSDYVGGLVGRNADGATVTNSYWDTETSGQTTSAGGAGAVGYSTSAMIKDTNSVSIYVGWDFTNTWKIDTDPCSYPYLQWQGDKNIPYPPVQTYTITYSVIGSVGGSLSASLNNGDPVASGDSVEVGSDVTFTAIPDEGYEIKEWKQDGYTVDPGDNILNVSAIGSDLEITVEFSKISVNVTGITLNQTTMTLVTGDTGTLTATIAPADATNKDVVWSSDNSAVATVDSTGKVTAVAAGTATITVLTVDGGKTVTCVVYVKSTDATLSDLTVNGTTVEGFAAATLAYNVELAIGTTEVPTVVATVNDTGKASAVVTAAESLPGTTTVVVTAEDGTTTMTYTISFTIEKEPLSVTVTKADTAPTGLTGFPTDSYLSNQNKVTVEQTGNTVTVSGSLAALASYTQPGQEDSHKWVVLFLDTGEESLEGMFYEGVGFTYDPDMVYYSKFGVGAGTFVQWIKAEEVINTPMSFTLSKEGKADTEITISFTDIPLTLESIAISTPATKTEYKVGEILDITGMVVTGTYSDSSTKEETITADNVTGFDSSAVVAEQTLTVTVGSKTTTYTISVAKADGPELTGVTANDDANTLTGITEAMEFSTNGTDWTAYNGSNLPDLTGTVALQVRIAATETHTAGPAKTFNFTVEAGIQSVAATNGTVTITLAEKPIVAPVESDFTATVAIDGGSAVALTLTYFNYDSDVTVTYNFTPITQTASEQSVVVAVTLAGTETVAPAYTVEALVLGATGTLLDADSGSDFNGVVYERAGSIYYNQVNIAGTWGTETLIGTGTEGRLAIDSTGNPHIAYTTDGKIGYRMYDGADWTDEVLVTSNNTGTCSKPDIAVDGSGKAHITYTDTMGNQGDDYDKPDIMYATNKSGSFVKELTFNGNGTYNFSNKVDYTYYNNGKPYGSVIAVTGSGDYYIVSQKSHRENTGQVYNTYSLVVKSNLGEGSIGGTSSDVYDIYDLTANGGKVIALYNHSGSKSGELTVNGTTINFDNIHPLPGGSVSSVATDGTVRVVGGVIDGKLQTFYNGAATVYEGITVQGTIVSVAYINGKFYAAYTDNSDGKIKMVEIGTP